MHKSNVRLWLFRFILVLIVIAVLEAIGYLGMWVNSRSFDYLSNKNYFNIRAMLLGDKNPEYFPRYLSLPYLGYIPYPGYKRHGVVQHNEDGYRGNKVPLIKTDKFRILCLGGSTTYGFAVDSPYQTFPAQLEVLVNSYILGDSILNKRYSGAEIINAGLEAGNSAEELQQYLFKYRYYGADAVIVHSGVNDAILVRDASPDFQLDYTHYRRMGFHLETLDSPLRWFMKSYLVSFFTIRLFYHNFTDNSGDEFNHKGKQTFSKWSHVDMGNVVSKGEYELYPFYKNSKTLYKEIISDSSILVIFPNALNRNYVKDTAYKNLCVLNASLSKELCNKVGGTYVPFDFDSIKNPACWVDDCHLNAKGEKGKAEILLPEIIKLLTGKKKWR